MLHDGQEAQVDLAARNAKSSCFAAFFSGGRLLVALGPGTKGKRDCSGPTQFELNLTGPLSTGCRLGTQPLTGGHRCLLFYSLVWEGGSKPPQLQPGGCWGLRMLSSGASVSRSTMGQQSGSCHTCYNLPFPPSGKNNQTTPLLARENNPPPCWQPNPPPLHRARSLLGGAVTAVECSCGCTHVLLLHAGQPVSGQAPAAGPWLD